MNDSGIHYPVMHGEDNKWYLNHDWQDEYAITGSIFLDYRNKANFSDDYLIIYGHRMDSGRMFSDIGKYAEREFFDKHLEGRVFRPGAEYEVHVYAFARLNADSDLYNLDEDNQDSLLDRLDKIDELAMYRVESEAEALRGALSKTMTERRGVAKKKAIDTGVKLALLSTCNRNSRVYRDVLFVYLVPIEKT